MQNLHIVGTQYDGGYNDYTLWYELGSLDP